MIRGAIAGQILQQAQAAGQINSSEIDLSQTGDHFQTLFLDDRAAVFQNAYPAVARVGEDGYELRSAEVRLLPATALSSKTNDGFKPKAGVFDSLIDSFCAREHGHFYEPHDLEGDRVEPFGGFYSKTGNIYHSHPVSKRLLTRVGINRRRATAQEEILYSIEVLNEIQGKKHPQPMVYKGAILIENDALAEQLHQFIAHNSDQFRLGGSTSRGLGKVVIATAIQDLANPSGLIKQRIDSFNQKLAERWQWWHIFNEGIANLLINRTFFTIDLQSDAILSEQWRRTMVISEEMLREFADIEDPTLELHSAYSSYDYRSGWNAAWGLQRDVELVTKMGGVYLFSTQQPTVWYEKLADLELRGVGDQISEGFGQVRICDEFHQIVRENPV
ncbi:CRISPR-associated RAMP protein Csx10 [Leptolyngbya sp. 7M]|uniref:type III-D CRISPR-associated RAMP protein Csx10 n=1 Tax=Leptolyngbya sp. 7M TaxID=2812896 RepID=UPI001B8CC42E|nr:CRISPR-associated RAMP protein Csx10 [Leptolyngbya sp. 7M]QYO63513.1 CRISPR-associated RAMP protein Csx10 [Leptolyngbya sp. 7M]